MNIALIIAGGTGSRMGQDIPKQFLNVFDKPVIIYTLEVFERNPLVDEIEVVCIEGWKEVLRTYSKQFGISKLSEVVSGGETAQESIRNGVFALKSRCKDSDIVIIHDGVRPLIETQIISDVVSKCAEYGNAVSSLPYNEQIFIKSDETSSRSYIPRDKLRRVVTPQAYKFSKLLWAYEKAFAENIGISSSSYTNTLMSDLGETLYFASGSEKNIKLTTKENLEIFKAYLRAEKDAWLKG